MPPRMHFASHGFDELDELCKCFNPEMHCHSPGLFFVPLTGLSWKAAASRWISGTEAKFARTELEQISEQAAAKLPFRDLHLIRPLPDSSRRPSRPGQ